MTENGKLGLIEVVKQLGFPTVVAGVLLWVGNNQIELAGARFDRQQDFITSTLNQQLEKSTTVMAAINVTMQRLADEQQQTRDVLHEVQAEQQRERDAVR